VFLFLFFLGCVCDYGLVFCWLKKCKTVFVVSRVLFWNARNIITNGCLESVGIV
jgi:hypothetical protein